MVPEWSYYFLVGCNQFGSPMLVAFCVSNFSDFVVIMPLMRMHPSSMPNAYLPLQSSPMGRIVTEKSMLKKKDEARLIWEALRTDTQYRMCETDFESLYPGKKFSALMPQSPNIQEWSHRKESANAYTHNTNYALEA